MHMWESKQRKVRIRVLRCHLDRALAAAYLAAGEEQWPCPFMREGQAFQYGGQAVMPEGFCPWAWQDIYKSVHALHQGATMAPWNNRDGQSIVCCTDGIRPVVFQLTAQEG